MLDTQNRTYTETPWVLHPYTALLAKLNPSLRLKDAHSNGKAGAGKVIADSLDLSLVSIAGARRQSREMSLGRSNGETFRNWLIVIHSLDQEI